MSLTTRESARRDPYGRLPDALGMCDDLRRAGRSARFILCMRPPPYGCVAPACVESALRLACCCHGEEGPPAWGLPLRARARISIDPEDPTGAPLEEPKSVVQPSLLAGDPLQAPDPDRTGSGGAEKYKWGSIDAPREADPGHAKHGRYIEFVYESATSKVSNSASSNSSPDSQIQERMTWEFWGFYKWGSIDASRRADHARVPLGASRFICFVCLHRV